MGEHDDDMVATTSDDSDSLEADFSFQTFDEGVGLDMVRSVKIKCPGVQHNDVAVLIIRSGCIVEIDRKASRGVDATKWEHKFEYKGSDGHFDLRDDQITLDGGFLTLVFQAFQPRVFRFPEHFDMSVADEEDA